MKKMNEFLKQFAMPIEVRALGTPHATISGYYDDIDILENDLKTKPYNWYFVFNPIQDVIANNKLTPYVQKTTADEQIAKINWLLVDCDPIRASGSSATSEAHKAALMFADDIVQTMTKEGWPEPISVDSGNGCHLYYRINQENTEENKQFRAAVLTGLAERFDNEEIHVDRGVFNSARISRLPGTINYKGETHRSCNVIHIPITQTEVTTEQLEAVAQTSTYVKYDNALSVVDVDRGVEYIENFINDHNIQAVKSCSWRDGWKWLLSECPFCLHGDHCAILTISPNGAKGYKCSHNSCVDRHWVDFKTCYEGTPTKLFKEKETKIASGKAMHIFDPGFADLCKREWIIEGFLPRSSTMTFAGDAKAGKSTVMCGMANSVLCQFPWLGELTKSVPIVYLDWESGPTFIYNTCSQFVNPGDQLRFNPDFHYRTCFDHPWQETSLPNVLTVDHLKDYTTGIKPGIVVIDTVTAAFSGFSGDPKWSYNNGTVRQLLQPFHSWSHSSGWSIIFVHHFNKSGGIEGSMAWQAGVDVVCKFWRDIDKSSHRGRYDLSGRLDKPIDRRWADYSDHGIVFVPQGKAEPQNGVRLRADRLYDVLTSGNIDKIETMPLRALMETKRVPTQNDIIDDLVNRKCLSPAEKIGRKMIFQVNYEWNPADNSTSDHNDPNNNFTVRK
jgi:hypothetical protein